MMLSANQLSIQQLKSDLRASRYDVNWCIFALGRGMTEYNGKSIQDRLDGENRIIDIIEKELKKRGELDG